MYYGQDIVTKILTNIHIWKCTANSKDTKDFMDKYSEVNEFYLKIRKIITDRKIPRRLELNHNLKIDDELNVTIVEYPETMEGILKSFVDR
jgi:dipeptidyl-peptidase-3